MEEVKALPIIIGGFYRSGTSLVRRLLDAHGSIHCGPEVKFFKDLRGDYINDPLRHVRLFSTLPSLGLTSEEVATIFGQAFVAAHDLAAHKAGKARWADKNPENVLYLQEWKRLLPNGFAFIHVVRHPLDVLASLQEIGFPKAMPPAFEDKVKLLKTYVDSGAYYEDQNPQISIRVRYEELVGNTTACLSNMFTRLGEAFEPQVLDNINHPNRGFGIEDPKVIATDIVHNRSVGRWRTDLATEQVKIAQDVLGPSFAGYVL